MIVRYYPVLFLRLKAGKRRERKRETEKEGEYPYGTQKKFTRRKSFILIIEKIKKQPSRTGTKNRKAGENRGLQPGKEL